MSSGDLTVLSRYSRKIARPIPPTSPTKIGEQYVARLLRPNGRSGHQRLINDANIARAQTSGDSRLLQLLQQAVVELLVGIGIVLEDVVLHQLSGQIVRLRLLLISASWRI